METGSLIDWLSFQRWLRVAEEGHQFTEEELVVLYYWFDEGMDALDAAETVKRQSISGRVLGSW